ncbi:MAG: DUF2911 domain-containing protein [Gemmatimonadales bacterium]|nr:DUF2911 domain-containing protein [Gemmatimonadales bacterium]
MRQLSLLLFVLAGCNPDSPFDDDPVDPTGPTEQYGFVTVLGADTVGAEQVTRSADAMISESVDRWPLVRFRHTEYAISPDGRLTRMTMAVSTPSGATPVERWRKVRARFAEDSVHVTIEDSSGITGRSFATAGALVVPHISMQYAPIEFAIASAIKRAAATGRAGDTLLFRQFYPDRDVGPRFVLHCGRVIRTNSGRVELRHDWLAGTADVTIDSSGRMLTYSGQRTTYKVLVTRTAAPPDIDAIRASLAADERQRGPAPLSVRDTARVEVGSALLLVDYGRPLRRGRMLLGNVIGFDQVWRTGANEATHFTTSSPITIAGLNVPAGSYTLWTMPHADGVELIVNRQTGQWGTSYDPTQDLGRVPMQHEEVGQSIEAFTIRLTTDGPTHATMVFEWGTFRWTAPLVLR